MSTDSYERHTQLLPASAVLAPISLLPLVTFRADDAADLIRSIGSLVALGGVHLIVMRVVRDRGNAIQQRLWASWGGNTTVRMMRWSAGSAADMRLLRARVEERTGIKLPSPRAEQRDAVAADAVYERAAGLLREATRDHERYPRVWSELKHYGAARYMLGLRPAALVIAASVAVLSAGLLWLSIAGTWQTGCWPFLVAGLFAFVAGLLWAAVVTPEYVRTASERYSDALLRSAGN
ncbi:hypothetical protein RWH45_06655 [Microbacterium sp. KSW4-17]|uniref:DUF2207 domain-containing protein n=1 Tax=Microbacterium galbum TaxID=3075994 RepID=A0ABU3T692_9MICO|nr:hypothetical protein [Microbacterium sp. KSW4-17]MDU0366890.1 hypothetical protein [Microbacterium sp. KSW4-17]